MGKLLLLGIAVGLIGACGGGVESENAPMPDATAMAGSASTGIAGAGGSAPIAVDASARDAATAYSADAGVQDSGVVDVVVVASDAAVAVADATVPAADGGSVDAGQPNAAGSGGAESAGAGGGTVIAQPEEVALCAMTVHGTATRYSGDIEIIADMHTYGSTPQTTVTLAQATLHAADALTVDGSQQQDVATESSLRSIGAVELVWNSYEPDVSSIKPTGGSMIIPCTLATHDRISGYHISVTLDHSANITVIGEVRGFKAQ